MKKLTAIFMSLLLALSLAACGSNGQAALSLTPENSSANDPEETGSTDSKTLVVYYSATGNTEEAANYIAAATGGDIFELEPAEPYTDADLDWTDESSRVVYEHDNPDARDIELAAATVDNWEECDIVFIGYPKIQYGFLSV